MRVGRSLPGLLALGVLIAAPAVADEVVLFTNGTVMPVTSHRVEKDMVLVELGGNSRMAFPLYMVDKIESYGRSVFLNPTYHPANQAVAATDTGGRIVASPVSGEGSVPSRFRSGPSASLGANPNADLVVRENARSEGIAVGASGNIERLAPDPVAVADRANTRINSLRDGIPVGQLPQGLAGSMGRRSGLVRLAPRQVPIESGAGNSSGNQGGQPPAQRPSGPQTNPDDNPAGNPPQSPSPGN